ncbi:unnamed protein product [Rotaria sp. Silwood2]|nr:unnamed protein product [Rotaria sp. Silwood2]
MWRVATKMLSNRTIFPAVQLNDGRILTSGGLNDSLSNNVTSAAELYSPSTGQWIATNPMRQQRYYHTMTLLSNGKQVLVTGGHIFVNNTGVPLNTAEIYNITSETWTSTSRPMPEKFGRHRATLLKNGRVLIVGGNVSKAYYYDANNSSLWIPTGPMTQSNRRAPTVTLLADGRVLVTGGWTTPMIGLNTAEIYDPVNNTWRKTARNMTTGRVYHAAVRLNDSSVLIAGGYSDPVSLASAELYFPSNDSFVKIANTAFGGVYSSLTLLSNGYVLLTSGGDANGTCSAITQLYNPSTRQWSNTSSLNYAREGNFAFVVSNGVFTCGGDNEGQVLNSCDTLEGYYQNSFQYQSSSNMSLVGSEFYESTTTQSDIALSSSNRSLINNIQERAPEVTLSSNISLMDISCSIPVCLTKSEIQDGHIVFDEYLHANNSTGPENMFPEYIRLFPDHEDGSENEKKVKELSASLFHWDMQYV